MSKKQTNATCPHIRAGCVGACNDCHFASGSHGAISGKKRGDLDALIREVHGNLKARPAKPRRRPAAMRKHRYM